MTQTDLRRGRRWRRRQGFGQLSLLLPIARPRVLEPDLDHLEGVADVLGDLLQLLSLRLGVQGVEGLQNHHLQQRQHGFRVALQNSYAAILQGGPEGCTLPFVDIVSFCQSQREYGTKNLIAWP